jgi:hypothetical protein
MGKDGKPATTDSRIKGRDGQSYMVVEDLDKSGKGKITDIQIWGPDGYEKHLSYAQMNTAKKDFEIFKKDLNHVKKCNPLPDVDIEYPD